MSLLELDFGDEIVVDNHSHPLADEPISDKHFHPFQTDRTQLTASEILQCFSLGGFVPDFLRSDGHKPTELELRRLETSAESTLLVAFALKRLSEYFDCDETPAAVAEARKAAASDYSEYVRALYRDAQIDTMVVDNGWPQPPIDVASMRVSLAPTKVHVVFRIEPLLERLIAGGAQLSDLDDEFTAGLRAAVEREGYVGYKSIVAYRSGLAIQRPSRSEVTAALAAARNGRPDQEQALRDFLFVRTLEIARELDVSVHVHCGIGDNDVVMTKAMPHCLFPLLTDQALRHTQVVLVHGGYPWLSEGAFLANVLPNVYVDVSLACPATGGALRHALMRVLEVAPFNKILYGSDGLTIPEIAWVSAHLMRKALGETLTDLVERGYCSQARARAAGQRILWRNAYELYGLT